MCRLLFEKNDCSNQATDSGLTKEIQRYNDYLNYLNMKYPQMPNFNENESFALNDRLQKSNDASKLHPQRKSTIANESILKLKKSIKTTYMILIVSKWFILLNLPYFVCWCVFFSTHHSINLSQMLLLRAFVNLFEILFLFSYSINFILYLVNGKFFRKNHSQELFKLVQSCAFRFTFCFRFILNRL